VVSISINGDDIAITSRPDHTSLDNDTGAPAPGGGEEPRTLEILDDVEEDNDRR
jgi:hypothetical protein